MRAPVARLWATPLALGLCLPLVCISAGWSQPAPPEPPTFELPEVEVAGKRPQVPSTTPASVSVISADEIAAMGTALTVADVLRVLPEIRIKDSGGPGSLTTVSIRGSSSGQVQILLDGIPLNRPDQPSVDLSTLPIQNVDHIEVLRGPFSALYGTSTLGGVINIVTRSVPQTTVSARMGSFGETANIASLGGEISGLTYLIQGILTGSTGFAPDTDYGNSSVMTKLHWATAEDAGVTFTLNRLWHVVGTPGPLPTSSQDLQSRTWEGRTLLDLTWRSGRPDGPGSMLRVYALDDDIAFSSPRFVFQSDDAAHLWGAQGQIVLAPWAGHLVTFGTEYQGQVIAHTDNTPSGFHNVGSDFGMYVEDDWQMAPSTLVSAGVREDVFQTYGTQVNPRAGVVILLGERLSLRASAGRTFRAPSFDELAPSFSGNPALQPETAWEYNLGLEYALASDLSATVTGYYKDATNLITSSPPTFTPMNVGHAIVAGGSVEIVGRLADRLFVRANYTNQQARDASSGQDVIYVPRQLGTVELTYQMAPGSSVNVIISYLGDQFADSANTSTVPGHWLTSLTVAWQVGGGLALQAGVSNLFDVSYQESLGFLEPGRRYFVTATTSL